MDIVSRAKRSQMMSNIRSSNTRPEIRVRKLLHAHGFRYRLGTKVMEYTPDIVLSKYRVAIFIHGCFWHRHPNCKYATNPATNVHKWQQKFEVNIKRDQHVEKMLLNEKWRVAVIWECWAKRRLDIDWLFSWIRCSTDSYVFWPEIVD